MACYGKTLLLPLPCVCELKNTVFSTWFKYGRQKTNTDSRKILTAEDAASPAVTCNDSSDEGCGLPNNIMLLTCNNFGASSSGNHTVVSLFDAR